MSSVNFLGIAVNREETRIGGVPCCNRDIQTSLARNSGLSFQGP